MRSCTGSELVTKSMAAAAIFLRASPPFAILPTFRKGRGYIILFINEDAFPESLDSCATGIGMDFCRPVPILTRQYLSRPAQSFSASRRASSAGLLYVRPPSTYVSPGTGGISMVIGMKNVGAALVARPACQIVH